MKNIIIYILCIVFLSGCGSGGRVISGGERITPINNTQVQAYDLSEKAYMAHVTETSRQACYNAVVAVETAKVSQYAQMYQMLTQTLADPRMSPEMKMFGMMMYQQNQTMQAIIEALVGALGGKQDAPLACKQMGVYEYKLAQSETRWKYGSDLAKSVLKFGLIGYGIDQTVELGSLVVKKLSEPSITSGDGSTNVIGDGSSVDNRDFTGSCAGTVDPATGICVEPVMEEEITDGDSVDDSPAIEDPAPIEDPLPDEEKLKRLLNAN